MDQVICPEHGRQGIGLVCTHIAHAIDTGEPVGFFWGDDIDTARPDAWCRACEQALLAVPAKQSTEAWFLACDFKVLCAACWDLAKHRLYESQHGKPAEPSAADVTENVEPRFHDDGRMGGS